MQQEKPTIVSGITATGKLTLGNYIGAIKNFIEVQNDTHENWFDLDIHGAGKRHNRYLFMT